MTRDEWNNFIVQNSEKVALPFGHKGFRRILNSPTKWNIPEENKEQICEILGIDHKTKQGRLLITEVEKCISVHTVWIAPRSSRKAKLTKSFIRAVETLEHAISILDEDTYRELNLNKNYILLEHLSSIPNKLPSKLDLKELFQILRNFKEQASKHSKHHASEESRQGPNIDTCRDQILLLLCRVFDDFSKGSNLKAPGRLRAEFIRECGKVIGLKFPKELEKYTRKRLSRA